MKKVTKFSGLVILSASLILAPGCKKKNEESSITGPVPVVHTGNYSHLLLSTVIFSGAVTDDGGNFVTKRGFCWSSSNQNPTIHNDTIASAGNGAGSFSDTIKGLKGQTTYYIRAYATNNNGTGYGSIMSVKTMDTLITDIDNNHYRIVQIGTQIWMAENLKVTHYRNGEAIPEVTGDTLWSNLTTGAFCWVNNESGWGNIFGALYNWKAVSDSRNLSPADWHVSTDVEWTILINYLGGENVAGGKMKAKTSWLSPNLGADNSSSFSALPGGWRSNSGVFDKLNLWGYWWSSTESNTYYSWFRSMFSQTTQVTRNDLFYTYGLNVRCVKD